jgi:serine/threonine-protein kinase
VAISKSEPRTPSAEPTPLPTRIGRFDVIDRLASGGMADVFICCERGMGGFERLVVVKCILPHLAMHQVFVQMFLAEARYVARLSHPNVVQIIELGQNGNAPYLAMEYVSGSSVRNILTAAIDRGVPTPVGAAFGIIAQACAGAHAAHELTDPAGKGLGLVHRDISPHNLMATAEGHVKLLDFGIAKATEDAEIDDHTRTGALKGKVHYMAPEQCKQQPLDRRADVFALGIVLWELLAQQRLFKRESDLDSMQAIVTSDLKSLFSIRPDLPHTIVHAVAKSLARERDERYQTADEMRRALLDACNSIGVRADIDAVSAFVQPLLGDAHAQRMAELVSLAQERTIATPIAEVRRDEVTVVDKKGGAPTATVPRVESPAPLPAPRTARRRVKATRQAALIGVAIVTVTALAFVVRDRIGRPPAGAILKVAFAPLANREGMTADLQPFASYLAGRLHRPVEIVIPESYQALSDAIVGGEVHVAALPPYVYVLTTERDPRVQALAVKLSDGSSGSDGLIYVTEASPAQSLKDVKGTRFCFTDVLSTTGYLLPRLALREAGIDPDRDVIAHVSGSHENVMRDLTSGVCDAAATYNGGYLAADRAGIPVASTRQLALTGRSPQDALVAGPSVPPAERERIRRALFEFKPTRADTRAERVSGFAPISDRDYDRVRAAHQQDRAGARANEQR